MLGYVTAGKINWRLQNKIVAMLFYVLSGSFYVQTVSATDALYDDFNKYNRFVWEKSEWANGYVFDVIWKPNAVTHSKETGLMTLMLDACASDCDNAGETWPYTAGEYRTQKETFGYGYYEVRLKAAKGAGVVTSFFTYVPGPDLDYSRQDEIDIEILGRTDPFDAADGGSCNGNMMLQVNYFHLGSYGNEIRIPLSFDASVDFHTYAFDWRPNYISWYVDGVLRYTYRQDEWGNVVGFAPPGMVVYDGSFADPDDENHCAVSVTKQGSSKLPTTPGKVMMNFWAGRTTAPFQWNTGWLGEFNYSGPQIAQYDWVRVTP